MSTGWRRSMRRDLQHAMGENWQHHSDQTPDIHDRTSAERRHSYRQRSGRIQYGALRFSAADILLLLYFD